MCELGVDSIESFIISRAKQEQMTSEAHFEGLQKLWEASLPTHFIISVCISVLMCTRQ